MGLVLPSRAGFLRVDTHAPTIAVRPARRAGPGAGRGRRCRGGGAVAAGPGQGPDRTARQRAAGPAGHDRGAAGRPPGPGDHGRGERASGGGTGMGASADAGDGAAAPAGRRSRPLVAGWQPGRDRAAPGPATGSTGARRAGADELAVRRRVAGRDGGQRLGPGRTDLARDPRSDDHRRVGELQGCGHGRRGRDRPGDDRPAGGLGARLRGPQARRPGPGPRRPGHVRPGGGLAGPADPARRALPDQGRAAAGRYPFAARRRGARSPHAQGPEPGPRHGESGPDQAVSSAGPAGAERAAGSCHQGAVHQGRCGSLPLRTRSALG